MHVVCSFESKVQLLFWFLGCLGGQVVAAGHKIPKLKFVAFMVRPVHFGCCGARSQLSFYHIMTFQLVRSGEIELPVCLSLRNLGFGAESARCVLVEISAHFGASISTFEAPLAVLESKDISKSLIFV